MSCPIPTPRGPFREAGTERLTIPKGSSGEEGDSGEGAVEDIKETGPGEEQGRECQRGRFVPHAAEEGGPVAEPTALKARKGACWMVHLDAPPPSELRGVQHARGWLSVRPLSKTLLGPLHLMVVLSTHTKAST